MDVLEEAKEIMKIAGCEKAFAVYGSAKVIHLA